MWCNCTREIWGGTPESFVKGIWQVARGTLWFPSHPTTSPNATNRGLGMYIDDGKSGLIALDPLSRFPKNTTKDVCSKSPADEVDHINILIGEGRGKG